MGFPMRVIVYRFGMEEKMIKVVIRIVKDLMHEIIFQIRLKEMDDMWRYMGGSCFGLFPPSFYYTHTEEEIERITAETVGRTRKMISRME